ncbi:hypothetical protein [Pectobacterium polaris]|uniref:DUF3761 domain-containing protein n=1 Tax=Pectobacterium polaris TaxID=2042057 RepID=A0AAW4P0M2_9GAMM|nr:hypothetical protein [Pectobacterium polaris]ASY79474.1 hypothetical protein BJK05_05445 [Pectobacterium polaris]MBW5892840.1 hypothetical protein [Pectobacterium polaris]MCA6943239.1 hypothetical protein [Pectobacterium polaris]MCA6956371.1 hypothetical protein [Pectobacterium polaris]MCL6359342.1 hypothetical protein [Pectobacterium polaris]
MKIINAAILAFVCSWQGLAIADMQKPNTEIVTPNDKPPLGQAATGQTQDNAEAGRNECWSAKSCSGKILNNKDAHNCKLSGGKSWRSKTTGQCTNL